MERDVIQMQEIFKYIRMGTTQDGQVRGDFRATGLRPSFMEELQIRGYAFSPDFFDALTVYDWPGNVRELLNTMERVLAIARFEPTLFPRHLPTELRVHQARASVSKKGTEKETYTEDDSQVFTLPKLQEVRDTALANAEKQYLHDLVLLTKRNIREACQISGLSRSRLYYLLKKYGISKF